MPTGASCDQLSAVGRSTPEATDKGTQRVALVVGDWVVDEYWLLARHYSDTSSYTGYDHYRVASRREDRITQLCGAGHVAHILHQLFKEDGEPFRLVGIGSWHRDDEEHLRHLVHSYGNDECQAGRSQFRLKATFCASPSACLDMHSVHPEGPTTRAIRTYTLVGGKLDQMARIDWEERSTHRDEPTLPTSLPDGVSTIVVHDLGKGSVSKELVSDLRRRCPDAQWYVRAKSKTPEWLDAIDTPELYVVGPEVVAPHNPFNGWIAHDAVAREALDFLDDLPGRAAVVLSERRELIARFGTGPGRECVWGLSTLKEPAESQIGWASAAMAALVYELALSGHPQQLARAVEAAIAEADARVTLPSALAAPRKAGTLSRPRVIDEPVSWDDEKRAWDDAYSGDGVIRTERGPELQLWRAERQIPGYIACIREKQELLLALAQRLRAFGRNAEKPLGILLRADPGAGKTSLAKAIAKAFDFAIIRTDITQLLHREELLDLFDEITTRQAHDPRLRLLVFVDEINASIDSTPVYSSFLAPLEEGTYARRGRAFFLRPCVFLFAGTNLPGQHPEVEKLSDFESRLEMTLQIDYKTLSANVLEAEGQHGKPAFEQAARLELVYLGARMIENAFPDVTEVSRDLLRWLHDLPMDAPNSRRIRRTMTGLRNVQYSHVTTQNLPEQLADIWGSSKMPTLPRTDSNEFVRLVALPPPATLLEQSVRSSPADVDLSKEERSAQTHTSSSTVGAPRGTVRNSV